MMIRMHSGKRFPGMRRAIGFTLIEMMIVVVVVSILAMIAYPSYLQFMQRAKRSEGRIMLLNAAALQERSYSDTNQYTGTVGSGGLNIADPAGCSQSGVQSESCYYTLTIGGLGANNQTFTLTATPTFDDPECSNLTLTNAGVKGESGSSDLAACWGK